MDRSMQRISLILVLVVFFWNFASMFYPFEEYFWMWGDPVGGSQVVAIWGTLVKSFQLVLPPQQGHVASEGMSGAFFLGGVSKDSRYCFGLNRSWRKTYLTESEKLWLAWISQECDLEHYGHRQIKLIAVRWFEKLHETWIFHRSMKKYEQVV